MTRRFVLDSHRSRFTVQALAAGVLAGFAHSPTFAIRRFSGQWQFDAENPAASGLSVIVEAASLDLLDQVSESDRRQIQKQVMDEVLEVEKFPRIELSGATISTDKIADGWYRGQIRGDMRLHGMTRPVTIDSQLRLGQAEGRLGGEFMLAFPQFGIKRVSGMGGLLKIRDDLKFKFDLVGGEQSDGAA